MVASSNLPGSCDSFLFVSIYVRVRYMNLLLPFFETPNSIKYLMLLMCALSLFGKRVKHEGWCKRTLSGRECLLFYRETRMLEIQWTVTCWLNFFVQNNSCILNNRIEPGRLAKWCSKKLQILVWNARAENIPFIVRKYFLGPISKCVHLYGYICPRYIFRYAQGFLGTSKKHLLQLTPYKSGWVMEFLEQYVSLADLVV